jgi:AcrR family transcriptional regulator
MTSLRRQPSTSGPAGDLLLIDAAVDLLLSVGVAGLRPELVDHRAGLPPGSCRARYHSLGELVGALLEEQAGRYVAELDAIVRRRADDPAAGLADVVALLGGPRRAHTRAVLAVMLDSGSRRAATMYVDAIQTRWERAAAAGFNLTARQARAVLPLVHGLVLQSMLHDAPPPDRDVLVGHLRALLAGA